MGLWDAPPLIAKATCYPQLVKADSPRSALLGRDAAVGAEKKQPRTALQSPAAVRSSDSRPDFGIGRVR